jgi:hypothetical protein
MQMEGKTAPFHFVIVATQLKKDWPSCAGGQR